jgi:hypothetical protein
VQRISPVECAMLFGVAVFVTGLTLSALVAIVVDVAYQAISDRRWPAEVPPLAVAVSVVAVVVGASISSALG